jgi:acyltransferase
MTGIGREKGNTLAPKGERIEWIDATKGLGILLIVLGHVWSLDNPSPFYEWMYAFHVPLFFFVSGLTLKLGSQDMIGVSRSKARTLLIPYILYAFLGYLLFLAGFVVVGITGTSIEQFSHGLIPPLLAILWGTLGDGLLTNSPLWFLPALFVAYLLGYAINTYIPGHALRLSVVISLTVLGVWIGDSLRLPFSIVPALIGMVFFQAGYYARYLGFVEKIKAPEGWAIFGALLAFTLLAPLNGFVVFAKGVVQNPVWFVLFGFLGIAAATSFSKLVGPVGRGVLAGVGRHSLAILVIHMLVIKVVKVLMIVALGTAQEDIESSLLMGVVVLVFSGLIMVPVIFGMERWVPWTLGRWQGQRAVQNGGNSMGAR